MGEFYTVAALFGFLYAGVMPLYAVLARENFPLRMMGTVIGGTAMAGSLGMALGPLAGGLIYDATASYTWPYVGSWAMGIGAFLIAMTFADAKGRAGSGGRARVTRFRTQPSNRLVFGKPFGGRRPASARLPIHSLSSGLATVKVRPAESRQVRPSAMAKTLASEILPSL